MESLPENAYDELSLGLDDIDIGDIDRDLNDNASIGSSIGSGPLVNTGPLGTGALQILPGMGSDPVSIPGSDMMRNQSFTSQTSTSPTSPLGSLGFFAATTVSVRLFCFVMHTNSIITFVIIRRFLCRVIQSAT